MSFDIVTLRGFVEKIVDGQLTEQNLASMHVLFESLKPAVKNREDAILGYIIGWTAASVFQTISVILKHDFTKEEIDEVATVIRKRVLEIKSRIYETFT